MPWWGIVLTYWMGACGLTALVWYVGRTLERWVARKAHKDQEESD